MNSIYVCFAALFISLSGCTTRGQKTDTQSPATEGYVEVMPSFQQLLDTAGLKGSILIYNPEKKTYYSNNFQWARQGQLPASTFKIPNSIIALETQVVKHKMDILPWDGTTRDIANWNQDLSFDKAFAFSCVPCYQQLARNIGPVQMRTYLDRLEYPGIRFRQNEIDLFWLRGNSRINQFEQVEFLERLYNNELPISSSTTRLIREIMVIDTTESYTLSGKTGWSNSNGKDNGWFVGFVERRPLNNSLLAAPVLFFATNVEPSPGKQVERLITGRRAVTEKAIHLLNWHP